MLCRLVAAWIVAAVFPVATASASLRFPREGPNGAVTAIKVGDGRLVIAGDFSEVGNTKASRIAQWDGERWSDLGGGLGAGTIRCIAIRGSQIYVGGDFQNAG